MKAVVVKGMEMPLSCAACGMAYEDSELRDRCIFTCDEVGREISNQLKHSHCPLVEVELREDEVQLNETDN